MSYAELGIHRDLKDSYGRPAFARATHFVSHAWKCDFSGFVAALGCWLVQSNTPAESTYFWVDAFVVNQHQTQAYPQEWWSTRFMEAIRNIGNTVLVLDPWEDPVPLTRAWVIWELYCTTVTGAKLHLAMSKKTSDSFNAALLESFEQVQTAMSRVDVSKSKSFHEHDEVMIHGEIQRSLGFTKMNEVVQARMLQWLLEMTKAELQVLQGNLGAKSQSLMRPARTDVLATYYKLKENSAKMMRETGSVAEAAHVFRELAAELEESFGKEDAITLSCLNQLAVTLQKDGQVEKATDLLRDLLLRRGSALGIGHEDTLQSASNLAVLLSESRPLSEGHFNEARVLFAQAMTGREASLGPDHPRTLYTVSNLGNLLSQASRPPLDQPPLEIARLEIARLAEAEALHARAVGRLTEVLHASHPLALTAMHNQACHWLICASMPGQVEWMGLRLPAVQMRACDQLEKVLSLRTEKLGQEHPDTMLTAQLLAGLDLIDI